MGNKVEPIDVLVESLRRSCGLFSQIVNDHAKLCNLESLARRTRPPIRRVDGTTQILTPDGATAYDEAEIVAKSIAIHEVEDDFRTAIQDTKKAIKHPSLAGAIEPIVDKPGKWLTELLCEIESMGIAAVLPYPCDDDPSQKNRMAALFAVLQRLNLLDRSQEIRGLPAPVAPIDRDGEKQLGGWYSKATNDTLTPDVLRKARRDGRIDGEKIGGRWYYFFASVVKHYPQHRQRLSDALNRTKAD